MSDEPASVEGTSPARAGEAARQLIRRTRQVTRRKFPAEEKIRIVLEGIRGEVAVSELGRREGIHPTIYYKWLKDCMEAGKGRRRGDTKREATSEEVRQRREEVERLKGAQFDPRVAETFLRVPETVWKELRAETERGR